MNTDTITSAYAPCNGNHYELYAGTHVPDANGWTYHTCTSCGYKWRSKTIIQEVTANTPAA